MLFQFLVNQNKKVYLVIISWFHFFKVNKHYSPTLAFAMINVLWALLRNKYVDWYHGVPITSFKNSELNTTRSKPSGQHINKKKIHEFFYTTYPKNFFAKRLTGFFLLHLVFLWNRIKYSHSLIITLVEYTILIMWLK